MLLNSFVVSLFRELVQSMPTSSAATRVVRLGELLISPLLLMAEECRFICGGYSV